MTTTTTAVPVRRSWADVVKGHSTPAPETLLEVPTTYTTLQSGADTVKDKSTLGVLTTSTPLQPETDTVKEKSMPTTPKTTPRVLANFAPLHPGPRGSLQCFCRGQVINMLGHYGWLTPFGVIDHPFVWNHFGRIYIHKRDIVGGQTLTSGDIVSFYLYADVLGLGAEACRLEQTKTDVTSTVDSSHPVSEASVMGALNPESIPANGNSQIFAINPAYFGEDESSEDGDDGSADVDKESLHGESTCFYMDNLDIMLQAKLEAPALYALQKVQRAMSPDRATTPGMTSDSASDGMTSEPESEKRSPLQMLLAFRPPPGLSLPDWLENPSS